MAAPQLRWKRHPHNNAARADGRVARRRRHAGKSGDCTQECTPGRVPLAAQGYYVAGVLFTCRRPNAEQARQPSMSCMALAW